MQKSMQRFVEVLQLLKIVLQSIEGDGEGNLKFTFTDKFKNQIY